MPWAGGSGTDHHAMRLRAARMHYDAFLALTSARKAVQQTR